MFNFYIKYRNAQNNFWFYTVFLLYIFCRNNLKLTHTHTHIVILNLLRICMHLAWVNVQIIQVLLFFLEGVILCFWIWLGVITIFSACPYFARNNQTFMEVNVNQTFIHF